MVGDVKNFQNSLGKAAGSADSFGSSLGKMAKYGALAIGAAGIGGLALTLRAGIKEFAEASKVGAQTGAVLKSTGGAANVTAGQVSKLAAALMQKSGVDDEAIQSGSNLLLTFTKIRNEAGKGNDIFDQATKATLNLSVAMGKDMSSSAILVGKALNDPLKGMTALNKAGIQFTQSQKDSIKAMVEAGNTMGAQKLILAELTTQFGGSAEALGKTLPGQLNILKESFSNMAGEMVGALVPAFTKVMNAASGFVQRLGEAEGARAKLDVVWDAIKSGIEKVGGAIKAAFIAIDWTAVGNTLLNGLRGALNFLGTVDYAGILRSAGSKVFAALKSAFAAIDWGAVGKTLGDLLVKALNALSSFVNRVNWNEVGQALVAGIGKAIAALATFLAGVNWPTVLKAIGTGIIAVLKALAGVLLGVATALGAAIVTGIVAGLTGIAAKVQEKIGAARKAIVDATGTAYANALGVGKAIVQGFIDGIVSLAKSVASKAIEVAQGAIDAVKGALGIGSPSKVFHEIGANTALGFINGLDGGLALLTPRAVAATAAVFDRMKAVVDVRTAALNTVWSKIGEGIERAFGAKTQQLLTNLGAAFDVQIGKVRAWASELTGAEKALQAFQGSIMLQGPTASESALAKLDSSEAERARKLAVEAAQAAMSKALAITNAEEKAAAVLAAEEQMRAALLAVQRAALTESAALERAALEAENAERRAADAARLAALTAQAAVERAARETEAAARIAALEASKAAELANLEEFRRIQGEQLTLQLGQLVTHLAKHPKEHDKVQAKIIKLLKGYGVDYKNAGELLGNAFANGLKAAEGAVEKAAKNLAKIPAAYLQLKSPAEKGPLASLDSWWKPLGPMLAKQMNGGAIAGASAGMAGGPMMSAGMAGAAGGGGGSTGRPLVVQQILDGRVVAETLYSHILVVDKSRGSRILNHGAPGLA